MSKLKLIQYANELKAMQGNLWANCYKLIAKYGIAKNDWRILDILQYARMTKSEILYIVRNVKI